MNYLKLYHIKLTKKQYYWLIGSISGVILSYVIKILSRKIYKKPNAPLGLPLIGNALLMLNQKKLYTNVLPRYGSIVMLNIGPFNIVYLNSISSIANVLKRKEALYRPIVLGQESHKTIGKLLVFINGDEWKQRRKFDQEALFGITNTSFIDNLFNKMLQDNIMPSISECINNNKAWYSRKHLFHLAFNAIFVASYGKTLSYNNPLFHEYQRLSVELVNTIGRQTFRSMLPGPFKKEMFSNKEDIELINRLNSIAQIWINECLGYDEDVWIRNGKNNKYYKRIMDIKDKENVTFIEKMIYYYHTQNGNILSRIGLTIYIYVG